MSGLLFVLAVLAIASACVFVFMALCCLVTVLFNLDGADR